MEAGLVFGRGRQKWLISSNGEYVGGGGGGGGNRRSCLPYHIYRRGVRGGRGRAGRGETKFVLVLNAACMHVVSHFVSLSHISVLLLQPLSIQKSSLGTLHASNGWMWLRAVPIISTSVQLKIRFGGSLTIVLVFLIQHTRHKDTVHRVL